MRVLLLDNHDSFTYNLYQQIARLSGQVPLVRASDAVSIQEIRDLAPDAVVLSPGPGRATRPADFGVCSEVFSDLDLPVLGVCLGHQGLGHFRGAQLRRSERVMHGRTSVITHVGRDLFAGMPRELTVVRYHSWIVEGLPHSLEVLARTAGGELMAMRDRERPLWGVQFHPESICTEHGDTLMKNFLELAATTSGVSVAPSRPRPEARRVGATAGDGDFRVHVRALPFYRDPEDCFAALYADSEHAFWLDASMPRDDLARYAYVGDAGGPHAHSLRYRVGGDLRIERAGASEQRREALLSYLRAAPTVRASDAPFPFRGGFVGALGYELKAECRDASAGPPGPRSDTDDAYLLFVDRFLCFDVIDERLWIVALSRGDDDEAEAFIDAHTERVRDVRRAAPMADAGADAQISFGLRRDRDRYLADIATCLALIRDGESYELCLTNQVLLPAVDSPLELYRVLRARNPSPYGAYLRLGDVAIASASPEQYLRVDAGGTVTSRPIKGTAARLAPGADLQQIERLRGSEKDRAENLMIVDLVRSDLGRVCAPGSVEVPELMQIESFATLHQMVSTVRGRLAEGATAIDCIEASFPGGSMTGAPKRRTMELLEGLEEHARGLYSGAIGFIGLDGAAHLSIAIRTAVCTPECTTVGIGGAIVDQSDPEAEYQETLLKARAIIDAIRAVCGEPAARSRAEGDYA